MIESNIDAVIARLKARAANLRNVELPLTRAGSSVRDYYVARFTDGSAGWAPNSPWTVAQKGSSRPGIDTGALRNSITSDVSGNVATVGTNVRYARWFSEGTGVYGPSGSEWTIRPKDGKALRFKAPGGGYAYARSVVMRGAPARPLMPLDQNVHDRVATIFRAWALSLSEAS